MTSICEIADVAHDSKGTTDLRSETSHRNGVVGANSSQIEPLGAHMILGGKTDTLKKGDEVSQGGRGARQGEGLVSWRMEAPHWVAPHN